MNDIPHITLDSQQVYILIYRLADDKWWDWVGKGFSIAPSLFPVNQMSLKLTPNKLFPLMQIGMIPEAAKSPTTFVIEAHVLNQSFTFVRVFRLVSM